MPPNARRGGDWNYRRMCWLSIRVAGKGGWESERFIPLAATGRYGDVSAPSASAMASNAGRRSLWLSASSRSPSVAVSRIHVSRTAPRSDIARFCCRRQQLRRDSGERTAVSRRCAMTSTVSALSRTPRLMVWRRPCHADPQGEPRAASPVSLEFWRHSSPTRSDGRVPGGAAEICGIMRLSCRTMDPDSTA